MAELEIEQNLSHEFDALTEAGAHLQPLSGPGCAGRRRAPCACVLPGPAAAVRAR